MRNSDVETLKALYYKVRDHLDYSEMREFEDLIDKLRRVAS